MQRKPFPTQAAAIHWVWLLRVLKGAAPEEVAGLYGEHVSTVRAAVGFLGVSSERPTIIPAIPIGNTSPSRKGRRGHKKVALHPGSRMVSNFGINYIDKG